MTMPLTLIGYTSVSDLYVFPTNGNIAEFADVDSVRVVLVEVDDALEAGKYVANVDPDVCKQWVAFDATNETSGWIPTWADAIPGVSWDLSAECAALDAEKSRQFLTNKVIRTVIGPRQYRYTVRNDNDSADAWHVDYDPRTGNKTPV